MSTPVHQPKPVARSRNGIAVTGFVLGLVGFPISYWVTFPAVAWPLATLGLVLSIVGFVRADKGTANEGLAIAGVVLSLLWLGLCVLWSAFLNALPYPADGQADRERVVVYEVSGDAAESTVTYSTFREGTGETTQETLTSLPWRKELTVGKGRLDEGLLKVTPGAQGGTVTCHVRVDGVEKKTVVGDGALGTATCRGF